MSSSAIFTATLAQSRSWPDRVTVPALAPFGPLLGAGGRTGNAGCSSASDTKRHAAELVEWLDERIVIDRPLNIHLTGCPNSCAQHYVADIGLLATKVEQGDEMVEGYDLLVGGGAGAHQALGRLVRNALPLLSYRRWCSPCCPPG